MKKGDMVKFKEIKDAGDNEARFVILEINGDRLLVEALTDVHSTHVYKTEEMEVVKE